MTKFRLDRLTDYSDEAILAEIRRVAKEIGGDSLPRTKFRSEARVGVTTIRRRFGSWEAALNCAGLGHLHNKRPDPSVSPIESRRASDQELLADLRKIAASFSADSLSVEQYRDRGQYGADVFRNRFGSWKEALLRAGLKPVRHGRRYTDEECMENLLAVWTHFGRPPKYAEMNGSPSVVGGKAYVTRWGTWNRALQAFVDHVNGDAEVREDSAGSTLEHPVGPPGPGVTNPEAAASDGPARRIPVRLRYRGLKRDRVRCCLCGQSPATDPSCVLHVDHVIPYSQGGGSEIDNLQVLCANCNLGKGDRP